MAGITEIRGRMRSIQQTLKITNAMYLISSAKVKKARKQLQEVEPYFDRLAKTILDIFRHSPQLQHRYIEGHHKSKEERKTGFVVITGDKGLAGAYNHNVLKLAESYLARKQDSTLFLIGQMGRHYFEKKNIPIDAEFMYTAQDPTLDRAQDICDTLVDLYERGALDEIYLVFTHSYSAMRMEPEIIKLLPLDRAMLSARRGLSRGGAGCAGARRHPGVYIRGAGGVLLQRAELPHERHGFRVGKRQGHAENAVPRVQPGPPRGHHPGNHRDCRGRRGPEPAVGRRFVLRMLPGVPPEKP